MKKTLLWATACLLPLFTFAQVTLEQKIQEILLELKSPDQSGFAYLPPASSLHNFEKAQEALTINLNIPLDYLDQELDGELAEEIMEHFAVPMSDFGFYTVFLKAQNKFGSYDHLAEFLNEEFQVEAPIKPNNDPSPAQFGRKGIDNYSDVQTKGQLQDATIWLSAGHGWIYDKRRNSFKTQRTNHHGIVEDFSNIEWINYHLLPYLYNAGANVWCVRERDMNSKEIIIDNDDKSGAYLERGKWFTSRTYGYDSKTYRYTTSRSEENSVAIFQPSISESGMYWVSVRYVAGANRSVDARYRIIHAGGVSKVSINQEVHGDTWVYLGQFYFEKGNKGKVILSNASSEKGQAIIADAVRFGGGMGSVADCDYGKGSDEPRFEEGAKYYAQYQGFSECMNDVSIRPRYAEWELSKGAPTEQKNAIYLSWHSNASGSSGTESYVHSYKKVKGCWSLQKHVHEQIIKDIRQGYDKNWKDRGKKAADFGELRGLRTMPGLLVEIGFHDNSSDARALSEPEFRNLTARATYKGIVQYFARKSGKEPVYLPEPPTHLQAINTEDGPIRISWKAPRFGGIYGHAAEAYKVYVSDHGKAFSTGFNSERTSFTLENPEPGKIYFIRVSALNQGGESFPTAVVAVRAPEKRSQKAAYLIVDGFDRLDSKQAVLINEYLPRYAPLGLTTRLFIEQMNSFNYATEHAVSLAYSGISFDGASNEAIIDEHIQLKDYEGIDWFLGRESSQDKTLSAKEQALLKTYLDQGGKLIISGSELGYDLVAKGNGPLFYKKYLKADFKGDDAGITKFASYGGSHFDQLEGDLQKKEYGAYELQSPDFIGPVGGSETILKYRNGKTAAIAYKGNFSLLHYAFPLESIDNESQRNEIFKRSVQFLNNQEEIFTEEVDSEITLAKFPAVVRKHLTLKLQRLTEGKASLRMTTIMGNEILHHKWNHDGHSDKTFNLSNLPKGLINYEFEINGQLQAGYFRKE